MPKDDRTLDELNASLGIEACIPALRRYGHVLVRDAQEVDDLVHDCLVRALERLDTRHESGDLRAWLFAIMHNVFVSRLRSARVRGPQQSLETIPEQAMSKQGGQEQSIATLEVLQALQTLSQEQQSVLTLVSVEGLTYAQVSQVLGIPIGTVMSRLSRAREKLANVIDCTSTRPKRP